MYSQAIEKLQDVNKGDLVTVMNKNKLLALGIVNEEDLKEKGIIIKIDRVIVKT